MNGRQSTGKAPPLLALSFALLVGCWSRASSAEPDAPPSEEVDPHPAASASPAWYGGTTLMLDFTSFVLVTGGEALDKQTEFNGDTVTGVGVFTYLLGGPFVHFSHSHVGKGFGSLGARLGLPVFGVMVGAFSNACNNGQCSSIGAGIGYRIGIVTAVAIDAAVLSFEEETPRAVAYNRKATSYRVLPMVGSKQAGLFVLGNF
jgi:hypothetical protein